MLGTLGVAWYIWGPLGFIGFFWCRSVHSGSLGSFGGRLSYFRFIRGRSVDSGGRLEVIGIFRSRSVYSRAHRRPWFYLVLIRRGAYVAWFILGARIVHRVISKGAWRTSDSFADRGSFSGRRVHSELLGSFIGHLRFIGVR